MPDIITTQIFSDGEKGITATKLNNIVADAIIQPEFVSAKPLTSTLDSTDQLLDLKSNNTYARISGAQLASSVAGQLTLADTTQNGMLRKVSGSTGDFVDGTNNCQPLAPIINNAITAVRLRNFNALGFGNATFEVDQRNATAPLANPASGTFLCDRWA